jgi:hypothetical protein
MLEISSPLRMLSIPQYSASRDQSPCLPYTGVSFLLCKLHKPLKLIEILEGRILIPIGDPAFPVDFQIDIVIRTVFRRYKFIGDIAAFLLKYKLFVLFQQIILAHITYFRKNPAADSLLPVLYDPGNNIDCRRPVIA